jgi:hypothetical protein
MVQYSESDLQEAVKAVANGQSIKKASLCWGVPRSTLQGRLQGAESRKEAFTKSVHLHVGTPLMLAPPASRYYPLFILLY